MSTKEVVVCAFKRTPIGAFKGKLSSLSAPELGALVVKNLVSELSHTTEKLAVDEVVFGCVLPAGTKMAPTRQVALLAGLEKNVLATTVNKVCGSSLKAISIGYNQIVCKESKVIIAGGMESMSNAPLLIDRDENETETQDHLYVDGLVDAYDGESMGVHAQKIADLYNFTKDELDRQAERSLTSAKESKEAFADEILQIDLLQEDEIPQKLKKEKIKTLKPAFAESGTLTAASSSSLADGAAGVVLADENYAKQKGLKVVAKIVSFGAYATSPSQFTEAPVQAIKRVLQKANWGVKEVDLFEINEAFASVPLIAIRELNIDQTKVNVHGGSCAIGHPLGASGARIVVTLINALRRRSLTKGVAAICIGGGEAMALAIECVYD